MILHHDKPHVEMTHLEASIIRRTLASMSQHSILECWVIVTRVAHDKWYVIENRCGDREIYVNDVEKDAIIMAATQESKYAVINAMDLEYTTESQISDRMKDIEGTWFVSPISGSIMKLGKYQSPASDDHVGRLKYQLDNTCEWREMTSNAKLFDVILMCDEFFGTHGAASGALAQAWRNRYNN